MDKINEIWLQMNNYTRCTGRNPTHVTIHVEDFEDIRNEHKKTTALDLGNDNFKIFGMKIIRSYDIKKGVFLVNESLI